MSNLTALLGLFVPLAGALAACGDKVFDPEQQEGPAVASVVISPDTQILEFVGDTVQLVASARDAGGNAISGKTFTWSSSDEDIARVTSSGIVFAVADGSVIITATSDGVGGIAAVVVELSGLSAFGTATIDGVFGPGEWDKAAKLEFLANLPANDGGGTTPATILVMNDDSNLYLAVKVAKSSTTGTTNPGFAFDNDDDGVREEGDDGLVTAFSGAWPSMLTDYYRTTLPPCPSGVICGLLDADNGGTTDGAAAGSNDGAFTYVELSHPLDSADDTHDFSLGPRDTVGFTLDLRLGSQQLGCSSGCFGDTAYPAPVGVPGSYADIVIASSPFALMRLDRESR